MTEEKRPGKETIPPKQIRAAGIAAGLVGGIVFLSIAFARRTLPEDEAPGLGAAVVSGFAIGGVLFLFILFALAQMKAGREWNRRGGRPDPFTRDS